jgi:hypothetical protein
VEAERRQVTVLFTDMVGFTSFSAHAIAPKRQKLVLRNVITIRQCQHGLVSIARLQFNEAYILS